MRGRKGNDSAGRRPPLAKRAPPGTYFSQQSANRRSRSGRKSAERRFGGSSRKIIPEFGGATHACRKDTLNGKHTVFGKVTSGMDVVDAVKQGDVMQTVVVTES